MTPKDLTRRIRTSAQLAALLEVSGWPKPGNVHRTRDRSDSRYEHFLAGSVVLGSCVEDAALRGLMVAKGRLDIARIRVGKLVKKAVSEITAAHDGGNTHLGVCLLFIPLAAAAAKTYVEIGQISPSILRKNVKEIMRSTTAEDAVEVYEAIALVSSPDGLGRADGTHAPDLYDREARRRLLEEGITLLMVMKESSSYDSVAKELATGFGVSFEIGYKELTETFNHTHDINVATVHTFLRILSRVPDTLIARKVGLKRIADIKRAVDIGREETMWISEAADQVLKIGGLTTKEGEASLWEFDRKLQNLGEDYNPGSTADLTAATLMIALLCGLRF